MYICIVYDTGTPKLACQVEHLKSCLSLSAVSVAEFLEVASAYKVTIQFDMKCFLFFENKGSTRTRPNDNDDGDGGDDDDNDND